MALGTPRLVQVFQRGRCGGETWTYYVASLLRRSPSTDLRLISAAYPYEPQV